MDYHNEKFKPINSTKNAETSEETLFHYKQRDTILETFKYVIIKYIPKVN